MFRVRVKNMVRVWVKFLFMVRRGSFYHDWRRQADIFQYTAPTLTHKRDIALWQERSLMVQWVVGSILHGGPTELFLFQPVLHDWCNKRCGMFYPVCGMVHIKEPLLLIGKSSPCGGRGFPLSLFKWSYTIV